MGMVLNNKRLVNGVHPKHAKLISKHCYRCPKSIEELAESLEVTEATMARYVVLLEEIGALETEVQEGKISWLCSPYGYTNLVHGRFGSPLSGSQFSNLVAEVIDRAISYNEKSTYPYFVEKIILFSPIVYQPWRLDDPDLAIETSLRPEVAKDKSWRLNYYVNRGHERNLGFIDRLFYPEVELRRFLEQSNKCIRIYFQDVSELAKEWKIVYRREAVKNGDALQIMSRTELEALGEKIDKMRNAAANQTRTRRKHITKSNVDIVSYWKEKAEFKMLGLASLEDASQSCWRCGSRLGVQRCHIIPDSLGGKDTESNLVLLCSRCHAEGPNIADVDIMFDWIKAYREEYPHDFWFHAAMKEYAFVYGKSVEDEIRALLERCGKRGSEHEVEAFAQLKLLSNEASVKAICHFGQPYLNTATQAGLLKIALRELSARLQEGSFEG